MIQSPELVRVNLDGTDLCATNPARREPTVRIAETSADVKTEVLVTPSTANVSARKDGRVMCAPIRVLTELGGSIALYDALVTTTPIATTSTALVSVCPAIGAINVRNNVHLGSTAKTARINVNVRTTRCAT